VNASLPLLDLPVLSQPLTVNRPTKTPFPHQVKAVEEMEDKLLRHNDILLWGATGVGKTVTQCLLAIGRALQGQKVVILLPLATLPIQFEEELRSLGWPDSQRGSIWNGDEIRVDAPIVIAMAPTIRSRRYLLERLSPDLVIVDEAHEQYFEGFVSTIREDHWAKPKWVWATATPWQLSPKRAYTRISEEAVVRLFGTMREIINAGFLVPPRVRAENGLDPEKLASIELSAADNLRAVDAKILKTDEFLEKCARIIQEHGGHCYRMAALCTDTEQADLFAQVWQRLHPDRGVTILHSKVAEVEWHNRMKRWKRGDAWLMLSIGQVLTGFDWKPLDGLAWLRPTSSPNLWVQGCGRPARICKETGKTEAIILDLVGNTSRVGRILTVANRKPQLKESNRKSAPPPDKICPKCFTPTSVFSAFCPNPECDHEYTVSQLDLDGEEDAPFGDIPDEDLLAAVNKTRGQLKSAFTRWGNGGSPGNRIKIINKLLDQFPGETLNYLYQWLRGSVFRGETGPAAQCEFLAYLHSCEQRIIPGWVANQFAIEFGFKLTDHAEITGHQLLGVPAYATKDHIVAAYRAAIQNCDDPEAEKLLRWAYDRAIATAKPGLPADELHGHYGLLQY
jgi:superfamily II DNA or RNA helicase